MPQLVLGRAVSALERRKGTSLKREYRGFGRNRLVCTNTMTFETRQPCLRSFSAARLGNIVTTASRSLSLVTGRHHGLGSECVIWMVPGMNSRPIAHI